jgi:23S rRNA U2552 (ribose-2'-O)-methylase RlmE/FtsJ
MSREALLPVDALLVGDCTVVVDALRLGANVNQTTSDGGRTPIQIAAAAGHTELFDLLVQHKADLAAKTRGGPNAGMLPIHIASQSGSAGCIDAIARSFERSAEKMAAEAVAASAQPNTATGEDTAAAGSKKQRRQQPKAMTLQTMLDLAIVGSGDNPLVGFTPLHLACLHGHTEAAQSLLSAGASANRRAKGMSPYDVAVEALTGDPSGSGTGDPSHPLLDVLRSHGGSGQGRKSAAPAEKQNQDADGTEGVSRQSGHLQVPQPSPASPWLVFKCPAPLADRVSSFFREHLAKKEQGALGAAVVEGQAGSATHSTLEFKDGLTQGSGVLAMVELPSVDAGKSAVQAASGHWPLQRVMPSCFVSSSSVTLQSWEADPVLALASLWNESRRAQAVTGAKGQQENEETEAAAASAAAARVTAESAATQCKVRVNMGTDKALLSGWQKVIEAVSRQQQQTVQSNETDEGSQGAGTNCSAAQPRLPFAPHVEGHEWVMNLAHVITAGAGGSRIVAGLALREHEYHRADQAERALPGPGGSPATDGGSGGSGGSGSSVDAGSITRAYYKVKEAVELYITGHDDPLKTTAGGCAVDVGSSPGGWTHFLASAGFSKVLAIDPAEMDEAVLSLSAVVHVRKRVEQAAEELRGHGPFSLVTCDMNMGPGDAAKVIVSLCETGSVAPGGTLILTLKFIKKASSEALTAEATACLQPWFTGFVVKHLFSNGSHEATLIATKL